MKRKRKFVRMARNVRKELYVKMSTITVIFLNLYTPEVYQLPESLLNAIAAQDFFHKEPT